MANSVIVCTPCLRSDNKVDAIKYCVECNENFCRPCLRRHIKDVLNNSQKHRYLDRDEMPDWLKGVPGITHCTRHPGNQLHTWCRDHDVVCCGACAVIEHSACANVEDFEDTDGDKVQESELSTLKSNLSNILEELRNLQRDKRKDQSALRRSTADALASVRDFRHKIEAEFDRLEKQATEDIDTECIKEDNEIERDIEETDKSIALIEMGMKKLNDFESSQDGDDAKENIGKISSADSKPDNNSEVTNELDSQEEKSIDVTGTKNEFISIVNGRRLLKEMQAKYQNIRGKNVHMVQFEGNRHLERYVKSLTNLGFCKQPKDRLIDTPGKPLSLMVIADDESICDIQQVIQADTCNFLLTDAENRNLKILDSSCRILSVHHFSDATSTSPEEQTSAQAQNYSMILEPFAVCMMNGNKVAVSMVRDKSVQVFQLGEQSEKYEEIDVEEYCRGLAYNAETEELYVACGGGSFTGEGLGHIRVYQKGELQRSFKKSNEGKSVTPRPMHISLSLNGSTLFVADLDKGVVVMSSVGETLWSFTAPELEGARGICVDVNNHVIVCGSVSNNILRIRQDWKTYDVMLEDLELLKNPQSVCYDTVKSKCLCSLNSCNSLVVFNV